MSASPVLPATTAGAAGSPARLGLLVKLRPSRPWRIGPASGARDRVDLIYHSDTLFSAITHAMRMLGRLEYWLEVTARQSGLREGPLVRFSSMFPFFGDTLYVTPPRHIWPPAPSVRVHYAGARFIPVSLVESIFAGKPLQDDRWTVDGASECLVPSGKAGPFRVGVRSSAAIDRITGASEAHRTACLEFVPKSGLWFGVSFADQITRDQWNDPIRAAIRLLADSGFGGERSRGWGRAHNPEFREGKFPQLIYKGTTLGAQASWLLSLVSPAESDLVDWEQGSYSTAVRGGRVDSPAGTGAAKKLLLMIAEGSVLHATTLEGSSPDVAPQGFSHPVFHAGWAFTISVPAEIPRQLEVVEPPPADVAETEAPHAEDVASNEVPVDDAPEPLPELSHSEDAPPSADGRALVADGASEGPSVDAPVAAALVAEDDASDEVPSDDSPEPSPDMAQLGGAPPPADGGVLVTDGTSEEPSVEDAPIASPEAVEAEALIAQEDASDEVPLDDVPEPSPEIAHLEDDAPLANDLATEDLATEDTNLMRDEAPLEIPTTDEELEQLENQDPGGPDDDIMPPMNDPGPMEPPFRKPEDLTPIDPEPGFENPPGPNPDEPEPHTGPVE